GGIPRPFPPPLPGETRISPGDRHPPDVKKNAKCRQAIPGDPWRPGARPDPAPPSLPWRPLAIDGAGDEGSACALDLRRLDRLPFLRFDRRLRPLPRCRLGERGFERLEHPAPLDLAEVLFAIEHREERLHRTDPSISDFAHRARLGALLRQEDPLLFGLAQLGARHLPPADVLDERGASDAEPLEESSR